jgi:phosphate uptake regulator
MGQEHIYKQFDADLEAVRSRVLQMGGLVEEQIAHAIDALATGNIDLAEQVIIGSTPWKSASTRIALRSLRVVSPQRATCASS